MSLLSPIELPLRAVRPKQDGSGTESMLKKIQRAAGTDPKVRDNELWTVAKGFEEMFLNMLFNEMRKGQDAMASGLWDNSNQSRIYRDMYDEELAHMMANKNQLGFSKMIHNYLARQNIREHRKTDFYKYNINNKTINNIAK